MTDETVRASEVWGPTPTNFRFGELKSDEEREGTALEWVERALTQFYFVAHDNRPSTWDEIRAWVDGLTPEEIQQAVELAVTVGLP